MVDEKSMFFQPHTKPIAVCPKIGFQGTLMRRRTLGTSHERDLHRETRQVELPKQKRMLSLTRVVWSTRPGVPCDIPTQFARRSTRSTTETDRCQIPKQTTRMVKPWSAGKRDTSFETLSFSVIQKSGTHPT